MKIQRTNRTIEIKPLNNGGEGATLEVFLDNYSLIAMTLDHMEVRELVDALLFTICEYPLKLQLQEERTETLRDVHKFFGEKLQQLGFDVDTNMSMTDVVRLIKKLKGE